MDAKACWEVDTNGNIVEHYFWTDDEIQAAQNDGKTIIDFAWDYKISQPKFDIANNKWIEGTDPQVLLDVVKQSRIAAFNQKCDDVICAGFTSSNGHTYRTNRDDQINMIGQKDDLADGTVTIVPWKTEDAGYINHTRDEWLTVYGEAFTYKKKQLLYYNELKDKINAIVISDTVTIDDAIVQVNAVVW